ncbi:NAD(P)H-dependent flavin oxidoreductase [Companilactobacillus mishanensis]|uniref:NAD(P)H-dependent flavin oxidoreductase n=1 Tax=Companilactobacillus mishanensis TaxID=2486008 RepID=UPI0012948BEA|nr:nitronate monooxygenase [Companilactobacillus mishanensis]MQS90083.1 nitronate monooxygenase [Companilactobacillus mishanensis]
MKNRITEILNIEKPIIQGPLLWLTDAKLVAAVSNAGGMGMLGFNAGQTTVTKSIDETIERMRQQIKETRKLTDKPFGLNFGPTGTDNDPFSEPMLKLMIEEKIPAVTYVGPIVPELFKKLKDNNIKIIYRYGTPNIENTREAEKNGADIIVATGFDEGGTVPEKVIGTFSIVPMIVDAVDHTPVMAAGGITDERTAEAAFALGAEGVYAGTAFLASEESRMADNIKQQLPGLNAEDMLMYRDVPAYYRSIPGELPNKLVEMDKAGKSGEEIFDASNRYDGMRLGMLVGDLSQGFASFGLGISNIHAIEPVQVIVDRLNAGIEEAEKSYKEFV